MKGDWGLKRSLPLRSTTKTSTPVIRIERMDTFEHITEFGSAADHTLSLAKWLEMGISLSTPKLKDSESTQMSHGGSQRSVFEDDIDTTAHEISDSAEIDARWKFSGPWLAGQSRGEFNEYVQKEVRKKKTDFLKFLRGACSAALSQEYLEQRTSSGGIEERDPPPSTEEVTDEQLRKYVKSLRQNRMELYKQIRIFLDLPPALSKASEVPSFVDALTNFDTTNESVPVVSKSPYRDSGPPKTHPSAGLSYGRTTSTLYNHPVFGPQQSKPPVEARIVLPKNAGAGADVALGVGGFIANTPVGDEAFRATGSTRGSSKRGAQTQPIVSGLLNIEIEKVGGSKVYVEPRFATVDPQGRVILRVGAALSEAVDVKNGTAGQDLPPRVSRGVGPGGFSRSVLETVRREQEPLKPFGV